VSAHPKIELRFASIVNEILGDDVVRGVRIGKVGGGADSELATDAVFAFPGLAANTQLMRGVAALDSTGRVAVDAELHTTARGICAAGNVRQGSPHRAASAMGDGAAAAIALDRYLAAGEWPAPRAGCL
jgi:thioredoxin reductase (NADPH)